jgi:hypothetical protein
MRSVNGIFRMLFKAAMEIADMGNRFGDDFAVRLQLQAQNSMGRGVLRPHVQSHCFAAVLDFHPSS